MKRSHTMERRLRLASLPFVLAAFGIMVYHFATGWRSDWYNELVLALILCSIVLQVIAVFFFRDV